MADVNISKFRAQVVREGSKPAAPGFVVSEGQNPVDPAGSGQNHLPVTIGTPANGLAVTEAQVLTIDKAQIFAGTSSQFVKGDGTLDSTAYGTGSVTSVALTMPAAFSVANSPVTTAGTLAVTATGTTAQYIRGDGSLATFPALTGFVPYTGATADVDLGTHDLTAERGTFQNNGSSDTLTVNHTSGSGYGIIVTKGGNNEALYVSKTSGSGNAMTVVGGRTSLVDLALSSVTNTAGDFLTLSGGVVHKRTAAEVRTDIGAGTGNGTVTSVAALTLGTSGTDLNSTVANGTTTPVITLNVPTASATNRGALSASDWTTFNNKQNALTNPVTGTGTSGQVAYFNGTTTITSESNLFWNQTDNLLGIGTNDPKRGLHISGTGAVAEFLLSNTNFTSGNRNFNIWGNTNNGFWEIRTLADNFNSTGVIFANLAPLTGNILINKNSDSGEKLQIIGGSATALRLESNANVPALSIGGTGDLVVDAPGVIGGRFFVNNSGNVGIGKNSPSEKLHVVTSIRVEGSTPAFNLYESTSYRGNLQWQTTAGSVGVRLFNMDNSNLMFGTTSTERMRLTEPGNLLIGTTTDAGQRLQVSGQGTFTDAANGFNIDLVKTAGFGALIQLKNTSASSNELIRIVNASNTIISQIFPATNGIAITTGNVGIGTSSPTNSRLLIAGTHVSGNSILGVVPVGNNVATIGLYNSSNVRRGLFYSDTGFVRIESDADPIQIYAGGVNGINVTTGGNVGIGTNSPNVRTEISGTEAIVALRVTTDNGGVSASNYSEIQLADNGAIRSYWRNVRDGSGATLFSYNDNLRFLASGTERMRITTGGNVGIGSIPNFKLNVFDPGVVISSGEANWSTNTRGIMVDNSNNGDESVGVWFRTGGNHLSGISGQRSNSASDWSTDLRFYTHPTTTTNLQSAFERMRITSGGNVLIGTTTDNGNTLRVNGVGFFDQGVRTGQPVGTTTNNWLLGRALASGTSTPDRWIRVQIGLEYYDILAVYMGTL